MAEQAGDERELDALVAVQVMGLPEIAASGDWPCPYCGQELRLGDRRWCSRHEWVYGPYKEYTRDIAAAWEVVEHFNGPPRDHRCIVLNKTEPDEWACEIGGRDDEDPMASHVGVGPTAPLAICRAALAAAGAGTGRGGGETTPSTLPTPPG